MQRSTDRILTTHVGSLPRPPEVIALLKRRDRDEAVDPAEFESTITRAVNDVVAKQVAAGVDIVNDGDEQGILRDLYPAAPDRIRPCR